MHPSSTWTGRRTARPTIRMFYAQSAPSIVTLGSSTRPLRLCRKLSAKTRRRCQSWLTPMVLPAGRKKTHESESELSAARTSLNKIPSPDQQTRPEYLRLRALIEAGFNDPASAEKDFKEAMSLAPKSMNIRLNYANLLWKTGRQQEALEQYKASLQSDPTSHAALTAMGYLSRDMHDTASAEKYFLKLAELYPKDFVPHFALGDLYTANKQFDRAQASYEKAFELAPKH